MSDEDYRRGYRDGWKDRGSDNADLRKFPNTTPFIPDFYPPLLNNPPKCNTCGMVFTGPMGYVCPHPQCPGRVTCTTVTPAVATTSGPAIAKTVGVYDPTVSVSGTLTVNSQSQSY